MNFWIALWKVVFVFSLGIFAVMAVWVTVAGLGDIRKLFAAIEKSHRVKSE
jgi:hypothetical protein